MKRENSLISKLVDKVLNETIEERANSLVSRLKHKEMKETHIIFESAHCQGEAINKIAVR